MHTGNLHLWKHEHAFGQEVRRPGEGRTIIVIVITGTMMVAEIAAGIVFGSMALLADGLHMASHAAALSLSAFAYVYARRHAHDTRYSFGTGKVNALAGFTGAILLAVFALMMAWESILRLLSPVAIAFDQAILVAVVGLAVNGASVFILGLKEHHHGAGHEPGHSHSHDHNLRAAYLHVLADTLTSILAILALLGGKFFDLIWMDPLMGILGAILVSRWSFALVRTTSSVLLDRQGPRPLQDSIRNAIERSDDNRVADLHVWSIGPDIYAAIVSVVAHEPRSPDHYKRMIPRESGLVHVTIEVHGCPEEEQCSPESHRSS